MRTHWEKKSQPEKQPITFFPPLSEPIPGWKVVKWSNTRWPINKTISGHHSNRKRQYIKLKNRLNAARTAASLVHHFCSLKWCTFKLDYLLLIDRLFRPRVIRVISFYSYIFKFLIYFVRLLPFSCRVDGYYVIILSSKPFMFTFSNVSLKVWLTAV